MVDFVRVLAETAGICLGCAHYDGVEKSVYRCNRVDGVLVPEPENCYAHDGSYVWQAVGEQPKARANDPATSKAAAKSIKPKVPSLKETILFLLERNPSGLTGTEIAELSGKRLNSITPRFAELYRGSKIKSTAYSSYRNGETVWVLA